MTRLLTSTGLTAGCALLWLAGTLGGAELIRGDADRSGDVDISDPIRILDVLFLGAPPLTCEDAADANDDGAINISDPIALLSYLFLGGSEPPPPFASPGADPTDDPLGCSRLVRISLGCLDWESYLGSPIEEAIFSQEELDRLVAERTGIPLPDCPPLPAIDFERHTLLGLSRCASGCTRNYLPEVTRDDEARAIHYSLTVEEAGACEPWVCAVVWVLVDKFPESYEVTFESVVVHVP